MGFTANDDMVEEQLPLTLQAIAEGNEAVIEEDQITSIEQKKLGKAKTTVTFEDMSSCDIVSGDNGDMIVIKKHVGNALRIGPLEKDVAARAHALIMKLWKG